VSAYSSRLKSNWRTLGRRSQFVGSLLADAIAAVRMHLSTRTMERERAVEALWTSEKRFRNAYKGFSLPTCTWLQVGGDFVLQDFNDASEDITGGCIREWVGRTAADCYAHQPDVLVGLRTCVAEQRTIRQEMRYRYRATGRERDLVVSFVFVPPLTVMLNTEDITELKQAEESLRVSEERSRLALQAARIGTWDVDLVTDVHVWSVETEALFGLEPGKFERSFAAFKRMVHPDDWPAFEREDAAAKAEHRASANIYRAIWPDGSLHWIEEMGSPLYDEHGALLRLTGTSTDVTERKVAEAALRVSEERNRLALQAANMTTWDWDVVHDNHTWSNETPADGQTHGAYERTFDDFQSSVHLDDWPSVEAEERAAQAERRDSITTFRSFASDGSMRWMESRGRSLYAEDGTLMRVTGTTMDITDRKLAEEALRTSEERFRKQYKSFPLPTYSWRLAGDDFVLQDFNDAAEAFTDGRIGEWLGILASDHYASQPGMQEGLRACANERKAVRREARFQSTSGSDRHLVLSYVFVPPETVMVHTEDVTDVKHAEHQRIALAQSEKLRALGQMASGIAHDLNQSLMLVASYSELARQAVAQDPPNLPELEDLLTTTTQAAMDGGETVKRLLLFTRAAPEQNSQPVDLSKVLSDAAQLTAPRWRDAAQAAGRPIALHIEANGHPTIQGSPSQLRELMTNVIFNAVDALPTGGTIRLRAVAEDGQGIIEVTDSGIGMTAEVQERVFEPFFTTKGEGGTGMGLAMVFGIVEQHDGHIEVHSAPGEGTTFRITLPLVTETAISDATAPPPLHLEPPRPLRVLVVDDEPMMTRAVMRMLKPSGHVVTTAGSGEEALQQLAAQTFDVVVSDMGMGPGMNGWDLADAVKQSSPRVRFLLATGWGAAIDPVEAKARGVEAVLAKPYHPADLLQALAKTPSAA
jgi:PAS domain S-box-containing protein